MKTLSGKLVLKGNGTLILIDIENISEKESLNSLEICVKNVFGEG